MGIKERRERDHQRMRERILGAAMELFSKGGYERVTMRAIAKRIEYSPATIYRYFENKDDILRGLCDLGFSQLVKKQEELEEIENPRERLRVGGRGYLRFAKENPHLYRIMFATGEIRHTPEDEDTQGRRSWDLLRNCVGQCLEIGEFPNADADAAALAIWASLHGLAMFLLTDQLTHIDEACVERVLDEAVDFSFRGV